MAGLWHMDCDLVEQEIGNEQPSFTPAKVGYATNPPTCMEDMRVRLLPPMEPASEHFPATGRSHARAITGLMLCSTLLLASIVRIIDVHSTNTESISAKVPDALAVTGDARGTTEDTSLEEGWQITETVWRLSAGRLLAV